MRKVIHMYDNWFFALQRGFSPSDKEDAEKLTFSSITLPHDWAIRSPLSRNTDQAEAQGFFDRWGTGWYKRELLLQKEKENVYYLCFDGIYENSTVWVNDTEVGGRKYGYSSYKIDVTDALRNGSNNILVKVDNTRLPADRWYSGAGIYRKVYLLEVPKLHLTEEDIQIHTAVKGKDAVLAVETGTEYPVKAILRKNGSVYVMDGEQTEKNGGQKTKISIRIPDVVLWDAEHPELYDLRIQLWDKEQGQIADEVEMRIGFRDIRLAGAKGLFVNGKTTKLKGVCIHQDAGVFGTATTKPLWRKRLEELKKIGCNALRLSHHIFIPEILELCDEMGFYVYEECFDKWTGGAYGRWYQTEWEEDLACMVRRDRNHPSILIWGVGNEVENQAYDSMLAMLEKHVAKVKENDISRPVSLAMNPHFAYPGKEADMSRVKDIQQFVDEMKTGEIFDMDDRVERIKLIAEKVDLISCNYQEQWYDRIHRAVPDKAILGTETYMYFRGYGEKFQNFMEECPWFDAADRDYCIGGMIWTGIDYLGESMGYPAKGWSGALFAADMEKRPIAWQYQSYWTKEPMVRFAVMDYSIMDEGVKEHWDYPRYVTHWEFPQFLKTVIPYMIATNCEQVELHVNEKEFLLKPAGEYRNHVITGYLPYLPGEVTVIGKNNGAEVCRQVIKTPGMAVKLAFEEPEQRVILEQTGEGYIPYQMLLKVRAFDADDNPVFRESARVHFLVEGSAELAGVENGDMKSWEPFGNDFIHLYHGRADVAIRIVREGRVRVTAFADGMAMAQAVVTAVSERKSLL